MPLPWLGLLDAALGVANMALSRRTRSRVSDLDERHQARISADTHFEARLASAVAAALNDASRERAEAERARAERIHELDRRRQVGDSEIARLRLTAVLAVVGCLGALLLSMRLGDGHLMPRVMLGFGWAMLLGSLACAFAGQSTVTEAIGRLHPDGHRAPSAGLAGTLAIPLIIVGLGLVGLAALVL